MIGPVIFDLFNTLVHGADEDRDQVVREMAALLGVAPAALVEAYHDSWRDRQVRWSLTEAVRVLARGLGADPTDAQVTAAAALRRAFAGRALTAVSAQTLAVLDRLRAEGRPLALVSNATAETAEAWPHCPLAERFDTAVFSCTVRLVKPDPQIYRLAAERLGVRPADCVFVGDGADGELAGAAGVGMTVLRTTQYADSDPAWHGPSVAHLGELPALLRAHQPVAGDG
jgi:putative hydrolase of the HAD superfamily